MTTRSFVIPMIAILASCNAKTLTVGGTPTGASTVTTDSTGVTSTTGATSGSGSCASSDCASYTLSCASGTPTNTQCVLDTSSQFAEPFCTLTGECTEETTPTCSWTNTPSCAGNGGACVESTVVGGSGVVTYAIAPPGGAGATVATLSAYFDSATDAPGDTYGDCVYNANGNNRVHSGEDGTPAPNPGTINVASGTYSLSTTPACDGLYTAATLDSALSPGAVLQFTWAVTDGDSGYGFPSIVPEAVPVPHFTTLAAGDKLAADSPVVTQADDLAVSWTVTGTPLALERLVVLITQGSASLVCTFDAGLGTGTVPANALLQLEAGSASYSIVTRQVAGGSDLDGSGWDLTFATEAATARSTGSGAGLANGTLTLQ